MSTDLDAWRVWWDYNREAYLAAVEGPRLPVSPSGEVARGSKLPPQLIHEGIAPRLRAMLERDVSPSVRAALLLALARIGEYGQDGLNPSPLEDLLVQHLGHPHLMVAETACIALGILARPSSVARLSALLQDSKEGRELYGRPEVSLRMRAFAAYGIGILGQETENPDVRRYATHALVAALDAAPGAAPDDRVAAVVALGLIDAADRGTGPAGCACASNDVLAARLLELLDERDEHDYVRAQALPLLARIAPYTSAERSDEIRDALLEAIDARREPDAVHQGAALALGRIGDADEDARDQAIRKALTRAAQDGDRVTRGFAVVSLAQVSARAGSGEGDPLAGSDTTREFLLRRLARAKSYERTWTALALGILDRGLLDRGAQPPPVERAALRSRLEASRSPDDVGACSIALGLCRDSEATAALLEQLDEVSREERGLVALALGMTGAPEAIQPLHAVLADARHEPDVLEDASIALRLLGDRSAVPEILGLLDRCDCQLSRRGVAIALGRSRDERAAEPLLAMLEGDGPDLQRSWAAFGLALLAEKDDAPWSARIATGVHYRASPPSLTGPSRAGILDLP